jgi:hypothetical protein
LQITASDMGRAMTPKRTRGLTDLVLGPIPEAMVNCTLELELEPGLVILTRGAQSHALKRHPTEYPLCLPHIAGIVSNPLYLGDDLQNEGKIEFIGHAASIPSYILVAVKIARDNAGNYHVTSFYPVSKAKIQHRRERGFLRVAIKKDPDFSGSLLEASFVGVPTSRISLPKVALQLLCQANDRMLGA